jgi:hypothetical protein
MRRLLAPGSWLPARTAGVVAMAVVFAATVAGQGRQGGAQAARTPRALAPIDLTGSWVSVVTEDWPGGC